MKNFQYKFDRKFEEILELQVTQTKKDKDFYFDMSESEYSLVAYYISSPKRILELGCGLGRFSIFLSKQIEADAQFYLADFSKVSEKIKFGWNPKNSVYNNLSLTEEFCILNDFKNFETFDLAERKLTELKDIDLVVSVLSVGFHYPIEDYLNSLMKITTEKAVFIFGIREGIYTESNFENLFSRVTILKNKKIDTKENILVLEK